MPLLRLLLRRLSGELPLRGLLLLHHRLLVLLHHRLLLLLHHHGLLLHHRLRLHLLRLQPAVQSELRIRPVDADRAILHRDDHARIPVAVLPLPQDMRANLQGRGLHLRGHSRHHPLTRHHALSRHHPLTRHHALSRHHASGAHRPGDHADGAHRPARHARHHALSLHHALSGHHALSLHHPLPRRHHRSRRRATDHLNFDVGAGVNRVVDVSGRDDAILHQVRRRVRQSHGKLHVERELRRLPRRALERRRHLEERDDVSRVRRLALHLLSVDQRHLHARLLEHELHLDVRDLLRLRAALEDHRPGERAVGGHLHRLHANRETAPTTTEYVE